VCAVTSRCLAFHNCLVPHFPPLQVGADNSSPAFSTPCNKVSDISSPAFSTPAFLMVPIIPVSHFQSPPWEPFSDYSYITSVHYSLSGEMEILTENRIVLSSVMFTLQYAANCEMTPAREFHFCRYNYMAKYKWGDWENYTTWVKNRTSERI